jgi:hypothetical protein
MIGKVNPVGISRPVKSFASPTRPNDDAGASKHSGGDGHMGHSYGVNRN